MEMLTQTEEFSKSFKLSVGIDLIFNYELVVGKDKDILNAQIMRQREKINTTHM